jgi:outer membrane protein
VSLRTVHNGAPAWIAALALLAVLAPAAAAAAGGDARPLTLDEAIARALAKNEDVIVERASLAAAEAGVAGARGAYDPLLQASTSWERAADPVNSAFSGAPQGALAPTAETAAAGAVVSRLLPTGATVSLAADASRATTDGAFTLLSPAYGTRVGVAVRQPLLRDRAVDPARFTLRVAAADRDRAAASLARQVSDTVAAVESAYWTLTAARREVGVRQDAVRLAGEQLSQTQIRIDNGASPETEIAQPRAELERRRGELLTSQEALARAENALKLLILGDEDDLWSQPLAPIEEAAVEVVPVDLPAALAKALASRPELDAAAAAVERRRAESAFARDGVRPALDAVVSYDRFGLAGARNPAGSSFTGQPAEIPSGLEGSLGGSFHSLGAGDFDDLRLGLELTVPLGNRAAKAAAAIAESAERQAAADLSRARKAIRVEVLDAAAAVETAGQRIEAARAAREAAEVQLDAERERFAAGLSTNFLVLTRQNDLERARLDEISALTDYRRARTEMARSTGALLADRGIELETDLQPQPGAPVGKGTGNDCGSPSCTNPQG